MKAMFQDRYFVWTIVCIVVIGVSLWAYVQLTIIELDAQIASF